MTITTRRETPMDNDFNLHYYENVINCQTKE